jgi:sugar phosphate isomerase/epimerase
VKLAVEPLNRYETSLINTTEQALALIDALDHPACGLLLDSFHMNIEEKSPAAAARAAAGRIAHVHAWHRPRGPRRRRVRLAGVPRRAARRRLRRPAVHRVVHGR